MADETQYEIRIEPVSTYVAEQSDPSKNQYVFSYTITITNTGDVPAQLISRHWYITDGEHRVQEVKGLGVIGQQPVLKPGESFEYTSGASRGCWPMTPAPRTSCTRCSPSVMIQCRDTSLAATVPTLVIRIV